MSEFPVLMHTAIDAADCRGLAEFYRQLLGLRYRPGDEAPSDGREDGGADWLVLVDSEGHRVLAVQQKTDTRRPAWPSEMIPMQMHMDFRVSTTVELKRQRHRAELLGATVLHDRTNTEEEPLYVMADPAGHPFCLLVR